MPIPTATWRSCCKLCKIGKWGAEVCASRELFCGGRGRWNVAGRCGGCRILSSKEIGRSFLFCFFAACLFVSLLSSRILQRGRKGIGKGEWEEADFGGWRFRLGSCDREWFYGVSDVAGVEGEGACRFLSQSVICNDGIPNFLVACQSTGLYFPLPSRVPAGFARHVLSAR